MPLYDTFITNLKDIDLCNCMLETILSRW